MTKATKPLGKGTRNISANVPNQLYGDVARLASISGSGLGEYVRTVLDHATKLGWLVHENQDDRRAWEKAITEGISPLPKIRMEVAELSKTISLPTSVFDEATKRAKHLGFTSFSAYNQHLIEKDLKGGTNHDEEKETPPHDAATISLRAAESRKPQRPKQK